MEKMQDVGGIEFHAVEPTSEPKTQSVVVHTNFVLGLGLAHKLGEEQRFQLVVGRFIIFQCNSTRDLHGVYWFASLAIYNEVHEQCSLANWIHELNQLTNFSFVFV